MKWISTTAFAVLFAACPVLAAEVNDLIAQLKNDDPDLRRAAAKELGEMGADAKPALSALVAAMKDRDLFVRRFSAQALGAIGPDAASSAVPVLKTALSDPKREVVLAASSALGKMGPPGITVLIDLAKDKNKDAEARKQAIAALGKAGQDGKAAVPVLTDLLKDGGMRPGMGLQLDAIAALGDLGPIANEKATVDALQAILDMRGGGGREVRQAVQAAMRKIKK